MVVCSNSVFGGLGVINQIPKTCGRESSEFLLGSTSSVPPHPFGNWRI